MVGLPHVTTPRRKSILLLEDDPSVSELFSATLTEAGYAVDAVSNGLEGLDYVGEAIPDLIISGISMPEVDGLQFLQRVRAQDSLRSIPVILLTGHPNTPDTVRGFELGADDYVPKQAAPEELLVRVNARIMRPPVPHDAPGEDRQTGLMAEKAFLEAMEEEVRAPPGRAGPTHWCRSASTSRRASGRPSERKWTTRRAAGAPAPSPAGPRHLRTRLGHSLHRLGGKRCPGL